MPALYVVRHGEPTLCGVLLGRIDPPLSEAGRAQISTLRLDVRAIYASPLRRTAESAAILSDGGPVITLDDLIEISLGVWDGRTWAEIERDYPKEAAAKLADWTGVTPPGGEPWSDFASRVDRALAYVRTGPLPAAIVGHLAVNAWIAHRLRGADPIDFTQDYGEIKSYEL
jgi:broad specificity phosphatase PhoE